METLLEYEHDVTGDGQAEKITLYGIPIEENEAFYKEIWAIITLNDGKEIRVDYEGGYEPKLDFVDLNHDGIDDILYSSATGGSGGIYNFALHTVKQGKLEEIPLPIPLQVESAFKDGFKAIMVIPGIKKPIKIDLSDRKEQYISSGLYQKNGKLNEPTELMLDPIALFEIIEIGEQYGLKSVRQVSGAYHADGIGRIEVKWLYENGKWNPIEVQWIE